MSGLLLWIAQGFGTGRIRWMPGTFGSLVGLLWFALLLQTGNFWWFTALALLGIPISVWICGAAEKILKQRDPGSIVLDEIVALPLCYLPWVATGAFSGRGWPDLEVFLGSQTWIGTLAIFCLFRLFDIVKPWPIGISQRLPGGWGVTADDVLAAVYVMLLSAVVLA